jgi:hypothetical protein
MSFNLKRPKRLGEEDEEDLIRFQEEFLKNKSVQPAATVVKKNKPTDEKPENNVQKSRPKQKVEIDCKLIFCNFSVNSFASCN